MSPCRAAIYTAPLPSTPHRIDQQAPPGMQALPCPPPPCAADAGAGPRRRRCSEQSALISPHSAPAPPQHSAIPPPLPYPPSPPRPPHPLRSVACAPTSAHRRRQLPPAPSPPTGPGTAPGAEAAAVPDSAPLRHPHQYFQTHYPLPQIYSYPT
ncbi:hypothetical protein B484DRAFT_444799 [Ochromonadaceae sp. CCMP2298]|nr:hypothetical protein B484DRAFT_444799 [Ochromonadaceae sp. CCMP2298]